MKRLIALALIASVAGFAVAEDKKPCDPKTAKECPVKDSCCESHKKAPKKADKKVEKKTDKKTEK